MSVTFATPNLTTGTNLCKGQSESALWLFIFLYPFCLILARMTQFTAAEPSMYEDPTPPSQELEKLELIRYPPPLFRNATVPHNSTSKREPDNVPPLRPYSSNLDINERKRRRENSNGDCSTDSAESTGPSRPTTNQNSFIHETKRRTIDTEKTEDTVSVSNGPFVTAQSIVSEAASSVDNNSNQPVDATAQSTADSFKHPIPPIKSDEPNWSAHPEAWGYLQSLNEEFPSKYLERTNEGDGNDRAGYMLGRSDRCELWYIATLCGQ